MIFFATFSLINNNHYDNVHSMDAYRYCEQNINNSIIQQQIRVIPRMKKPEVDSLLCASDLDRFRSRDIPEVRSSMT